MEGYKEILGIWIGHAEYSKFWLSVLNELRNRGGNEVSVFCVDGLNEFKEEEAIQVTFPTSLVQRCIIHQIRSSTKYVLCLPMLGKHKMPENIVSGIVFEVHVLN